MPQLEIPTDRPLSDDEVEAAIVHVLLNPGGYQDGIQQAGEMLERIGLPPNARGAVIEANGGKQALEARFLQIVWRWVSVGVLIPQLPTFQLAPGARELFELKADETSIVLYRGGLAKRLQERCPNLDPVTERYAAYGQDCFFAGHYQASAVMIGVATEAALLHFVPLCQAALKKLGVNQAKPKGDRGVHLLNWIENVAKQHRKPLSQAIQALGDKPWIADLPALLGIATGIRLTRNQAGHPTAHIVSRDECWNMLSLFPRLAEALFVSAKSFDAIV